MSYAIETKKRKFERILESLIDGAASQSRSSLNSRNNGSATSFVNDAHSDTSKRRRITPSSLLSTSKTASTASLTSHYLPSSRQAFIERLETFRQVTKWHIPSTEPINASAWVKRGWICVDTDTVLCGSCKERLWIDLEVKSRDPKSDAEKVQPHHDDEDEDFSIEKEVYEGLIKRYQDLIVAAHADSCPWRKRGCDGSIQRIEGLLNTANAISSLQSRHDSLITRADEIPKVSPVSTSIQMDEQELDKLEFEGQDKLLKDPLRLAVCGWQRKSDDVIECRYCFRSLGLWLYRGDDPAMDKLDPVESHLEYCPWRSPDALDTEITISLQADSRTVQKKEKVSGWVLVCQAIAKDNFKRRNSSANGKVASSVEGSSRTPSEPLTPEQREKRRNDLLRRIKELKKPFNVKSFLKKKEKSKV